MKNQSMKRCPQCLSTDIKRVKYMEFDALICRKCGYDERQEYEMHSQERSSQKEKGRFSPYKSGGAKRTMK